MPYDHGRGPIAAMTCVDMVESSSTLRPSRTVPEPQPAAPGRPETVAIFARQVLVFPLLVVLLACTSFLFGGRCAAWQWWTAVAAVVLVPFAWRDQWPTALRATGLFALLLFALRCLIPPLLWDDTTCPDMAVYHLPMVQLLIEGWNPVIDPMAEGITNSLGLDLWGMAPLHVAFLPKTMAVFSAVAYTFIRDPFALTFPGPFLLWLGVLLAAIRSFRGFARWVLVAAIAGILPMVAWRMPADLELAFASCGLLLAIQSSLRRKKCDWLALTVWAAWMMNLKFNGVLAAFVFCALFVLVTIRRERAEWRKWIGRFAALGGVLVLLWALISWNPLGTSWRTYGHPLYPFKTIDAERFPVKDLTWDVKFGNDDYREMSRAGLLAHAYLSPRLTISFYRCHLNQPDFEPFCSWWGWDEFPNAHVRTALWLVFCTLLILPAGRIWGAAGLVLVFLVPKEMIGFTRYQPWFSALGCLAVALLAEWMDQKTNDFQRHILSRLVFAGLVLSAFFAAYHRFPKIEYKAVERQTVHPLVRTGFWLGPIEVRAQIASYVTDFVPRYNYLTCKENYYRLLMKELGRDDSTTIESADGIVRLFELEGEWDERKWLPGYWRDGNTPSTENGMASGQSKEPETKEASTGNTANRSWTNSPLGYWVVVSPETTHYTEYYRRSEPSSCQENINMFRCFQGVLHAWFVTYPIEVWRRL